MLNPGSRRRGALLRLVLFGVVLGIAGCTAKPTPETSSSSRTRYPLKGKVISVDKAAKRLTIDHEEIPGFMPAMTMAYPVKDDRALDGLSPGDQVTATVVSDSGSFWLEELTAVRPTPTPSGHH